MEEENKTTETEADRLQRAAAILGAEVGPQQDLEVLQHAAVLLERKRAIKKAYTR